MDLDQTTADDLFKNALKAFQTALKAEDRAAFRQFSTAEQMLAELNLHFAERSTRDRSIQNCCRRISAFGERLNSYFDVMGASVQTSPPYAGWFWGSTLLICKLAGNYVGFFDKTTKMMEQITMCLPQYRDHVDMSRKRGYQQHDRLMKNLAMVYSDIIGFCQDIYALLVGKPNGSKWKVRVATVSHAPWKPFNLRFGELLERLNRHERLFRQEVELQNNIAIDKVQHKLNTLEVLYRNFQRSLDTATSPGTGGSDISAYKMVELHIDRHIRDAKDWISPVDYCSIYENAKRRRMEGSGQWFLSSHEYTSWRDSPFSKGINAVSGISFVQAKPGFGKTFLSSVIIDDLMSLQTSAPNRPADDVSSPAVLYFHFTRTSNMSGNDTAIDALRAIVTQLVHLRKTDPGFIDTMTIYMTARSSGQIKASYQDLLEVLLHLFGFHKSYLVIDGFDECYDNDLLSQALKRFCNTGNCKLLLLGRPDVSMPREPRGFQVPVVNLTTENNFDDILGVISIELEEIMDEGGFGNHPLSPNTPMKVARSASGVFLWARLFISYLRLPALTPRDRHLFILGSATFRGLEDLVQSIVTRLNERSHKEKTIARNIFRWVAAALYPLSIDTLHTALAITPGEETTDLDYLVDFPQCLPRLTGALIETDPFGRPGFIHLSVKQYLLSRKSDSAVISLSNPFIVHEHISSCCLSYMTHDIPKSPLRRLRESTTVRPITSVKQGYPDGYTAPSSFSNFGPYTSYIGRSECTLPPPPKSPTQDHVDPLNATDTNLLQTLEAHKSVVPQASEKEDESENFSFLRYSVITWSQHLWMSIPKKHRVGQEMPNKFPAFQPEAPNNCPDQPQWAPHLSRFLLCREAVTNWTEGSFYYKLRPSLPRLKDALKSVAGEYSQTTTDGRELHWIYHGMNQLTEALDDLWKNHSTELKRNSTLIWQKDFTSATDPHFWPVWSSTTTDDVDNFINEQRQPAEYDVGYLMFDPRASGSSSYFNDACEG